MKLHLARRSDGLLEPADDETISAINQLDSGAVFFTQGVNTLDRSAKQNRFYWGWLLARLVKALEDSGQCIHCDDGTEIPFTADRLHDPFFAKLFRKSGEYTVKGVTYDEYESTKKMSKARFSEYVEQIRRFSYQHWGIAIPEPTQYWDYK